MPDESRDPLLDPEIRKAYLRGDLWSDDPEKLAARRQVDAYFQATFDNTHDVVESKRTEALSRTLQRADDAWALSDPTGFHEARGHVRQSLEDFASDEENVPLNPQHKTWAQELVQLTAPASPYWDRYHEQHGAYLARATWLYQQIYGG